MRPAAAEWNEREETPWPVIQEAARIGLYGFEGIAQLWTDPSGLLLPLVNEELFWSDAGIGMSIMGTTLAVAGIFSVGTPEQLAEWGPQCYGTADEPKVGAFCVAATKQCVAQSSSGTSCQAAARSASGSRSRQQGWSVQPSGPWARPRLARRLAPKWKSNRRPRLG